MKKVFLFLIFLIAVGATQAQNEDFLVEEMTIMGEHALLVKTKGPGKVMAIHDDDTIYLHSNNKFVILCDDKDSLSFEWEESSQRNPEYPLDYTAFVPCAYDNLTFVYDLTGRSKIKGSLNVLPGRTSYAYQNGMFGYLESYFVRLIDNSTTCNSWYEFYKGERLSWLKSVGHPDLVYLSYLHAEDTLAIIDTARFHWLKLDDGIEIRP